MRAIRKIVGSTEQPITFRVTAQLECGHQVKYLRGSMETFKRRTRCQYCEAMKGGKR